MSANSQWPVPSFYFALSFPGMNGTTDAGFQEASGISSEIETEEVMSGGQNQFKYKLPKSVKYSNLVLKRGMMTTSSDLTNWCVDTLGGGYAKPIVPKAIMLKLLNENGSPLYTWKFMNAYPVKWSMSDLKSQESGIAIESIEFAYNYFEKM